MTPQHESSGREKSDGKALLAFPLWPSDPATARTEKILSQWWKKAKGVLHSCEVPLFVWIGSPGRTRTCDQPVTSAPVFQPGLDYLFTRLQYMQGRVSGASEALLDGFRSL